MVNGFSSPKCSHHFQRIFNDRTTNLGAEANGRRLTPGRETGNSGHEESTAAHLIKTGKPFRQRYRIYSGEQHGGAELQGGMDSSQIRQTNRRVNGRLAEDFWKPNGIKSRQENCLAETTHFFCGRDGSSNADADFHFATGTERIAAMACSKSASSTSKWVTNRRTPGAIVVANTPSF